MNLETKQKDSAWVVIKLRRSTYDYLLAQATGMLDSFDQILRRKFKLPLNENAPRKDTHHGKRKPKTT